MKINLICNDSLLPSTSDKNTAKNTEWVYDGSGAVSLYVNQKSLDILQDVSSTPKYIWLLESKQIIQGIYDWILTNYDFVASRVDGIFSCDKELCEKYPKFFYALSNAAPWIEERQIYEKTKLVSMISSNKAMVPGHRKRLEFVQKFLVVAACQILQRLLLPIPLLVYKLSKFISGQLHASWRRSVLRHVPETAASRR